MMYNVSIKHAGKDGEGAYLFSPANSGKNGVDIPSSKPLIQSNRLKIPVANIPAGDYEVKVQARDQAYAISDFSSTYMMHVDEFASFDIQAVGEVNVEVPVKMLINTDLPIDFDGGVEQSNISRVRRVV